MLGEGQTEICLIQEPYVFKGKIRGLADAGQLYCNNTELKPRACVLTSSIVKATKLERFCSRDMVAILTEWKHGKVVYASVYMPYEQQCPPEGVEDLTRYCRDNDLPLVLGCDSNAHHTLWGSTNVNKRGEDLCEFIAEQDLSCINKGNVPTFVIKNREEVIDTTFVSTEFVKNVKNWWVDDEESFSDHRFIKAIMNVGSPLPMFVRNRKRTNWACYQKYVMKHMQEVDDDDISTIEDIDKSVDKITSMLMGGFEEACLLKKVTFKKKHTPFWNKELCVLRKDSRRMWNAYRRNKTQENWETYRKSRNIFSTTVREAQQKSWKDYCTSVESSAESARMHKVMKDDRFIKLGRLKVGADYTKDETESVKHLLEQHFPSDNDRGRTQLLLEEIDTSEVDTIVTPLLVEKAIMRFGPFKAPGVDGIFPMLLQQAKDEIVNPLTKIFKACLLHGYIPKAWRKTKVVFLPKPGKSNYESASSWRPISLTSFLLKTLERLIDWYLRSVDLVQRLKNNRQFAYIAGLSTDAAIHQIVARAEGALKTGEVAICVFLDIKGAFNDVKFNILEKAMLKHGISKLCIRFISQMLRQREVNALGVSRKVERGCPQGGILSPLLWNLVVDELLGKLRTSMPQVYSAGYADDLAILARGFDGNTVRNHAQEGVNIAHTWTKEVGLGLAEDKIAVLLFSKKRNVPKLLKYNGKGIPYSKCTKYLGVTIDNKLTWNAHCKERASRGITSLAICKRAIGTTWGLRPRVVMWIYKAIVLPIMTYGAVSWFPASMNKTKMKHLERVQRIALVGITGALRSTSTVSLEAILNVVPIDIHTQSVALQTMTRLIINNQWLGWYGRGYQGPESHMDLGLKLLEQIPEMSMEIDVGLKTAKKRIKQWETDLHAERWIEIQACKQTKAFLPVLNPNRGKLLNMSRNQLRPLIQIITGHNFLNSHLYKLRLVESPNCICGRGPETGIHLICNCDKFVVLRLAELGSPQVDPSRLPEICFNDLANFIGRSGRCKGGNSTK
jgi:hypothetical protein